MRYWVVKGKPANLGSRDAYYRGKQDEWWTRKPPTSWSAGDRLFFWRSSPELCLFVLGELIEPNSRRDRKGYTYFKVVYRSKPLPYELSIEELRAFFVDDLPSFLKAGPAGTFHALTPGQGEHIYQIVLQFNANFGYIWPDIEESEYIELPAPSVDSAVEGRLELIKHLRRERDPRLARAKKAAVLKKSDRLVCEVCEFDFATAYGKVGFGFCEVHHERPLASLKRARRYKLRDLKILCSNCHRIIHKTSPLLKVAEFTRMISRRKVR